MRITNGRQQAVSAITEQVRGQRGQLLQIHGFGDAHFGPERLVRIRDGDVVAFDVDGAFNRSGHRCTSIRKFVAGRPFLGAAVR